MSLRKSAAVIAVFSVYSFANPTLQYTSIAVCWYIFPNAFDPAYIERVLSNQKTKPKLPVFKPMS